MKQRLIRLFVALGLLTPLLAAAPARAATSVIYDNTPSSWTGNSPSIGFEATSTKEFGGQVQLAGAAREDAKVTVLMSSWACESGHWNTQNCETSSDATFSHPITLNVYQVNGDSSQGDIIVSKTDTFDIDYRPSASPECQNADAGKWWDGTSCYNGKHVPITFDLTGTTLPDKVILTIAYNTTHHGYAPVTEETECYDTPQGCGYDSLNVATYNTVSVGSYPEPDGAYVNSTYGAMYCDEGEIGQLRFTTAPEDCWTGYQPAVKIEANTPPPPMPSSKDDCKKDGWKNYGVFKNQGDCVSYVATKGKNKPAMANSASLRF